MADDTRNETYVKAQIICAEIELQGMIAENKQREIQGDSLAYTEEAFIKLMDKYEISHNAVTERLFH